MQFCISPSSRVKPIASKWQLHRKALCNSWYVTATPIRATFPSNQPRGVTVDKPSVCILINSILTLRPIYEKKYTLRVYIHKYYQFIICTEKYFIENVNSGWWKVRLQSKIEHNREFPNFRHISVIGL